jgi:hypothetical protein
MKNDIDEYVLTRGEFAKRVGKTKNAVRLAMRRGKYEGEYRFDGKQFLFKDPDRTRANQGGDHPTSTIVKKKTYNRGNHYNAKYPNDAFRKYNESKMLAAVNERDPEFIKDYKEIRKQFKDDKAKKDYEKAKLRPVRYYGKMLYGGENSLWEKELKYKLERDKGSGSFHLTGKPYVEAQKDNYYGEPRDGSVEIPVPNEPDTNDLNSMPRFKSKVDEEIWRLKKKR